MRNCGIGYSQKLIFSVNLLIQYGLRNVDYLNHCLFHTINYIRFFLNLHIVFRLGILIHELRLFTTITILNLRILLINNLKTHGLKHFSLISNQLVETKLILLKNIRISETLLLYFYIRII